MIRDVGAEQDDGGQQCRPAGDALGVLGLLVQGETRVPAPVDEQGQQHGLGEAAPVGEAQRVEPGEIERRRVRRGPVEELPQRHHHEQRQHEVLHAEEDVLDALADLDAAIADVRHRGDERDAGRTVVQTHNKKSVSSCQVSDVTSSFGAQDGGRRFC
ncbi:hypothetical protein ACS72_00050 [Acinetobacter sp. VT 511]|nr:hypothetical protein ACS72_00050 [Acinetobacter sp. VT 511]